MNGQAEEQCPGHALPYITVTAGCLENKKLYSRPTFTMKYFILVV
jgi:hypothetical protein